MSPDAFAHPDRYLPTHITGAIFADPFTSHARSVRRVQSEVVIHERMLDLVAAELADDEPRARTIREALDAYSKAQDLASEAVRVPRSDLDVCAAGHLHRIAIGSAPR